MSESITFTVPGPPVGKARPRVAYRPNARRADGGRGRYYGITPDATVAAETAIAVIARQLWQEPWEGAIELTVTAYLPIPASWSARKRFAAATQTFIRPSGRNYDWDNLGKLVSDALNGIAYKDDCQIVRAVVTKWYALGPRTEVTVEQSVP